jgi:general nucleoside transport system ATP-binding protein
MMFGRLPEVVPETLPLIGTGAPVWQLRNTTLEEGALAVRDLDLTVRPGEVLGVAGLEGSGQRLLLRALAGHLRPTSGRVLVGGNELTGAPIRRFLDAGIEYLPADRLTEGMIGSMTLTEHEALRAPSAALVDWAGAARQAEQSIADYAIKATPQSPLHALSGGNQQRAMLALLPRRCAGVLLEQPTRGLDVASARAVWQRLLARRADGTALVFASSELDELLTYSDRVLVFFAGRVSPPLDRHALSGEQLAELIGGVGF